ncbi:MFS transporter [Ferrovum sp. PN-J185]|uniref:MFS transporter n=1 Tax=Ferrovum sp. PN-J185 TaxID=1356306 RepID=UPI0007950D2A|nr:MFS transporter [Ferrovum sp. PN-J185]KXW56110.1 inner membrane transport protein YajR [Ferrovum sp. PN-J185]
MKTKVTMTSTERRATLSLASVFALRMLGMFIILPVFALYAAHLPGGDNKTLVGLAMGGYGLTQALLQIPLGWLSDRVGRKPVIMGGLVVFALGSFVAATAHNIEWIIVGRMVQGAGAISSAIIAMTADLTRIEQRTKAMAMIGVTIGMTFSASMIIAPFLEPRIGVSGIFAMTGILALLAIGMVYWVTPNPQHHTPARGTWDAIKTVLGHAELLRLDWGIFVLHGSLMAMFVVVPQALVQTGFKAMDHWKLYLPVMIGSFILMIPGVALSHGKHRKSVFLAAIAVLLLSEVILWVGINSFFGIVTALFVFFTGFNMLEASLPSFITTIAPPDIKGAASGVYSSIQFMGTFVGASVAGVLARFYGPTSVPLFCVMLMVTWLVVALPMKIKAGHE